MCKLNVRYHEDPKALHIGACPNRAYYLPKSTNNEEDDARVLDLSGLWSFRYFDSFLDATDEEGNLFDTDTTIQVPSCWQLAGWGRNMYTNVHYPFPVDPPYVPEENPCGLYRRGLQLEEKREGFRYFLNFEGVDSCFYLWINDQFKGYSQVSHSTSEFEISDLLHEGFNTITVLVLQWCDGSYLEDQDKLRMSGIFRDVYILERPAAFLRDFFVKESFNEDFSHVTVNVELEAEGEISLAAMLMDPDGNKVGEATFNGSSGTVAFELDKPVLWNAEQPRQYTLMLATDSELIEQKVGLRKIEVKDGVVLLNGVAIKFRGVNRHDSDPVTGYTISQEQAVRDLFLMKQHNVNAIRTSHYPNAPWFMQLCSELGFYVIGEADLESHGMATQLGAYAFNHYCDAADDPQFLEAIVDRTQRNIIRDKNNAAAVIWSLGNESGWGVCTEAAARWAKEYDPSRLLHYENCYIYHEGFKADFSMLDLYSRMYTPTQPRELPWPGKEISIDKYFDGAELDEAWGGRRPPFVLCEYIHAMGNGPGDAEDYQQLIMKHDGFVGGFVWEWCDHAVYGGQTPDNQPIYRYGGDHNEFPHDGNFCMDGLVYPNRQPHTGLKEFKNVIRPIRARRAGDGGNAFILHNYLDFTNAGDYMDLSYEASVNGHVIASGKLDMPGIPPHGEAQITVDGLPSEGVAEVTFFYTLKEDGPCLDKGDELGFDQIILSDNPPAQEALAPGKVDISGDKRRLVLTGESFRYEFCRQTGLFSELGYKNRGLFSKPMEWNVYRAPTDNDQYVDPKWTEAGFDRPTVRVYEVSAHNDDNGSAVIECSLGIAALIVAPFVKLKARWVVDAAGRIDCELEGVKHKDFPFLPRFGVRMFMPACFDRAEYFGYGPYESYIDKRRASRLGIFKSSVADQTEHYLKPQENGSHYGCRWAKASDGVFGLKASSAQGFSVNISGYTQEELAAKKHDYELVPAGETVFCVDYKMSGVGSGSCGPQLMEEYQMNDPEFSFKFTLAPVCE